MSILFASLDERHVVMVSDACVTGRENETFPKFQVLHDVAGKPVFLGACGSRAPVQHLFVVLPKMLREVGAEVASLQDGLPAAINHMLSKRDPKDVDKRRDLLMPPVTMIVAGFDEYESRLRAWVSMMTGQGSGAVKELDRTDVHAIGFLRPEDMPSIRTFGDSIKEHGRRLGPAWIAREFATKMNEVSDKYSEVGHAAFAAGMDRKGLIDVSDLPMPWSVREARERAIAMGV